MRYLLKATAKPDSVETKTLSDITYNFFTLNDIDFALIEHSDNFYQLSVVSVDHSDIVNFRELMDRKTVRSQIMWDLLYMGGIKEAQFQIMYKQGNVPNNTVDLSDIDWSEVRLK